MYIYKRTLIIQVSVALSYKVTIGNIAQQTQQREPQLDKPQVSKHKNDNDQTGGEVNPAHVMSHSFHYPHYFEIKIGLQ